MAFGRKDIKRAFGGRLLYMQAIFVVIAFAIMVITSYMFVLNIEKNHLERELNVSFNNIDALLSADFQELATTLSVVSDNIREKLISGDDYDEVSRYITYVTNYISNTLRIDGFVSIFAMFDVFGDISQMGFNGAAPYFDWVGAMEAGYVPEERPWYIEAVKMNGDIGTTSPYTDVVTGETTFSYSLCIFDDVGERIAIVCMDVSVDRIYESLSFSKGSEENTWMLLDRDLNIIAFPYREFVGMPLRDAHEAGVSHFADDLERGTPITVSPFVSYEGADRVVTMGRLENEWYLAVASPADAYYENLQNIMIFLILLGLFLAAGLSIILMNLVFSRNRAEERTRLMFESSPLCINFCDENFEIIDCNETAVKFFGLKDKRDYFDRFYELMPELQPCGTPSRTKKNQMVSKAMRDGSLRGEWIAKMSDGELVPVELTMARVKYKSNFVVAVYIRDLREEKMMEAKVTERDILLRTVNRIATTLLSAKIDESFEESLLESMEFICTCTNIADSINVWRSKMTDDGPLLTLCYEWLSEGIEPVLRLSSQDGIAYEEFPALQNVIAEGEPLYGSVDAVPMGAHEFFSSLKIESFILVPLYMNDRFWGIITFVNSQNERTFSNEEINILRSAGLMIMNAVNRNDMLENINAEHEKTENLAHWYHTILDAIPLPVSVTDEEMNWTFVNNAVEKTLGMKRSEMLGWHCSTWGAEICNTNRCSIECFRNGVNQSFFAFHDLSYKTNVEALYDLNGETAGYVEVFQDITEIETMAKKQADIEAASNAKSAFLATVSHEIRTPMNTILGIAEIQLQNEEHPPEVEEAFTQISDSGDLLLNIINDILDLSKIEAGKMEIVPVRYDIPGLINDNVQFNYLKYEGKPIKFFINLDADTPLELFGDEFRIKQILNNLLSNAFKYTDEGEVELRVWASEAETMCPSGLEKHDVVLNLCVSDTGIGMTPEQLETMFEEFSRFNADRNVIGTGLGLSITKRLVEIMDGTITVESALREGSVFTVCLPQKKVSGAVCGETLAEKFKNFDFKNRARLKKTRLEREYMPYGSVLIVDDVNLNLQVAKGLMLPYYLQIETVLSGIEAVEFIKSGKRYDIIFMDHMMPYMNGIEATKIIRDSGYSYPIVALTANALVGQEEIFLKNGFDAFISKPIDSRELNLVLNEFIRNRKPLEVVEAARKKQRETDKKGGVPFLSNKAIPDLGRYFAKDAEHAVNVLESLYAKTEPFNSDDVELYITTVHGMKSALANVGENDLSKVALNLEEAGKESNFSLMAEKTPVFVSVLKSLIDKFKAESEDEAQVAEVSSEDLIFLRERLLEIKTACDAYDKQIAKEALTELKKKTWSAEINSVLDKIDAHLLHSAFGKVAKIAENTAELYY